MSGFEHDIAGGSGDLVATSVQSPNFASGTAGWQIRKDGSAQFNNGVFRGTVTAADVIGGTITGASISASVITGGTVSSVLLIGGTILAYSGVPGSGDLVASIASASGTDPFGNTFLAGIASYNPSFFAEMTDGALELGSSDISSFIVTPGMVGIADALSASTSPILEITAPATSVGGSIASVFLFGASQDGSSSPAMYLNSPLSVFAGPGNTPGTVCTTRPGSNSPETWHSMSLTGGWTVQPSSYARYKLLPDNSVWVQAKLAAGTVTNGTGIWTAPAGYLPSLTHGQTGPVICETGAGTAAALSPYVNINNGGTLMVQNLPSGLANCSVNFHYTLD